jgi:predicted phage baseplate assembly protein
MTLPKENLDTRTYEDLVKEAVSRIPVYAPEWTDHNVHDPGRTFIELFAWLAEMQIYNLNRITDRSRRKFLKLMGIPELRPAKAATVDVTFSLVTRYLFCWDDIPGNDDLRLREFLKQNFAIDWVETAKIEKIDNIKTIKLSYQKNYLSLKLNDEQTEVNLEIDDIRTDKFVVKIEKSKLNIYLTGTPTCIDRGTIVAASDTVSGEDVLFETQQDLMVINAELTKILVRPRDLNYFDRSEANKNENVYFYAFRSRPEVGDELYLGFDNDPGKDITLALHLLKDGLAEIESKLFPSGKVKWEYWDGSDWQRVEELFSWDDPENDKKRIFLIRYFYSLTVIDFFNFCSFYPINTIILIG